jgi:hypothetical protein
MKTILFLVLVVSLAAAQKPAVQKNRQVLMDFRPERNDAPATIPAATQRTVLSKVFRKYLTDESKCNAQFDASDGADALAAARKAGEIVPSINEMITGSFTAAGQSQTLYVISVRECNASHADNFGTNRVAIFSGQQLVADLDADFKSDIARKTDLNSDGIDELLMTSSYMGQGTLIEMASLFSFQNRRLQVIREFGKVVENSCASGIPRSNSKASVLYISESTPGEMPKLTMDNYATSCSKTRRWRFVSTGEMP